MSKLQTELAIQCGLSIASTAKQDAVRFFKKDVAGTPLCADESRR
jgi:hypothetical protein